MWKNYIEIIFVFLFINMIYFEILIFAIIFYKNKCWAGAMGTQWANSSFGRTYGHYYVHTWVNYLDQIFTNQNVCLSDSTTVMSVSTSAALNLPSGTWLNPTWPILLALNLHFYMERWNTLSNLKKKKSWSILITSLPLNILSFIDAKHLHKSPISLLTR